MVEVDKLLTAYKRKQQKEKERYDRLKDNPDFVKKNRIRAKNHYDKNKEKKMEKYKSNIDYERAKSSFYYYKKRNNIEAFKSRYPERYELMKDKLNVDSAISHEGQEPEQEIHVSH
jgi:hypothetical protein